MHSCIDRLHSDRGNASWECFCDKSTFEHAPLNLYLVDPHILFLSLFLYYSLRQTDVLSVCLSTDHTVHLPDRVTSGWVPVLLLLPLTVLLSLCLYHVLRAFRGCSVSFCNIILHVFLELARYKYGFSRKSACIFTEPVLRLDCFQLHIFYLIWFKIKLNNSIIKCEFKQTYYWRKLLLLT